MATSWVLGKVSDALAPTVTSVCSSAGSAAGGALNYVGSSINGVGESINSNIRSYGDGAKDYGNAIMDWSSTDASRAQTASNPLGLSGSTGGGKSKATSPSIYKAPSVSRREVIKTPQPTQRRVVDVSKPKAKVAPVNKPVPSKAVNTPVRSSVVPKNIAAPKTVVKKPAVSVSAVKPKIAAVPAATATSKKAPAKKNNPAANPLNLSF